MRLTDTFQFSTYIFFISRLRHDHFAFTLEDAHSVAQNACFIFISVQLFIFNKPVIVCLILATLLCYYWAPRSFNAIQNWLSCFSHPRLQPVRLSICIQVHRLLIFHDSLLVTIRNTVLQSTISLRRSSAQLTGALATWASLSIYNTLELTELFVVEWVIAVYSVLSRVLLLKCQATRFF